MKAALVLVALAGCGQTGLPVTGDAGPADLRERALAGEPCTTTPECPQAPDPQYKPTCLRFARFANGYCVQPCTRGSGCPSPGMSCRLLPSSTACFKDCTTDADCRTAEGYRCCPPWLDFGGPNSVCYPAPCPS